MNSEEKIYFANLVKVAFGKDAISKPSNNEYALLRNKLLKWPVGNLFPVLDVLRSRCITRFQTSETPLPRQIACFESFRRQLLSQER